MSFKTVQITRQEAQEAWEQLQLVLPKEILHAPRVDWLQIDPLYLRYLYQTVRNSPWFCHLSLLTAVLTCYTRLDFGTIGKYVYGFHTRWRELFEYYHMRSMEEWNPIEYFPRYLNDSQLLTPLAKRQTFLEKYYAGTHHFMRYIRTLSEATRQSIKPGHFPRFLPTCIVRFHSAELFRWNRKIGGKSVQML